MKFKRTEQITGIEITNLGARVDKKMARDKLSEGKDSTIFKQIISKYLLYCAKESDTTEQLHSLLSRHSL